MKSADSEQIGVKCLSQAPGHNELNCAEHVNSNDDGIHVTVLCANPFHHALLEIHSFACERRFLKFSEFREGDRKGRTHDYGIEIRKY